MAEKIILTFSGWCECDPDKVMFVSVSDADIPERITGREWLALTEWQDSDTIGPHRDDYTLEDTVEAQTTALDGNYEDWYLQVEEGYKYGRS